MRVEGAAVERQFVSDDSNFAKRRGGRFTLRELFGRDGWGRRLAVLLGLGLVFGWLGPYGTFQDLSVANRFIYWITAIALIGVISQLTLDAVRRLRLTAAWPVTLQAFASVLIVALPGVAIVIGLETVFRETPPLSAVALARVYVSVAVILTTISVPWSIIRHRREGAPALAPLTELPSEPSAAGGSPFLRRISSRLGTELLSIATEDHYLRVTTVLGEELILFRLSDAVAELDPVLGQQVHRSYWVARQAVSAVERQGHRTTLVLVNGAKVPVSRTYVPLLRAAGWLTEQ
jgi:hypothetical protein